MTIILVFLIISVSAYLLRPDKKEFSGMNVEVYKSLSCGCCEGYISELENYGFDVKLNVLEDPEKMQELKSQYKIPSELQGCHTVKMGDYFVEGHVPLEAVEKLLREKPDVDGLALGGMPPGAPGMGGIKDGTFVIYSIKNGEASKFMEI